MRRTIHVLRQHPLLCFLAALVVRILVSIFAGWYDSFSPIPFTDIDYFVFHDAAGFVYSKNSSPYLRETYRYTPLVSYLFIFNHYFDTLLAGKLILAIFDTLAGYFIYLIQRKEGASSSDALLWSSVFWLFNPFVIAITCRGSAESVICFLLSVFYYLFLSGSRTLAAVLFGLCVHTKIFPVIFIFPILFYFYHHNTTHMSPGLKERIRRFFSGEAVSFSIYSGLTFILLGYGFYLMYGFEFLYETYLYHIVRKDHRHNMSMYFYYFYLLPHCSSTSMFANIFHLACFLPQILLVIMIGYMFCNDLTYAFFLLAFTFVTFNKVITSQYFVWYIFFLPLIVHKVSLSFKTVMCLLFLWASSQALWLFYAYRLEFLGENVYYKVFVCSCIFFISNIVVLCSFVNGYRPMINSTKIKDQ